MLTRRIFLGIVATAPLAGRLRLPPKATDGGPRLFLTPARLEQAKTLKQGHLAAAWRRLHDHCDEILDSGFAEYRPPTQRDAEMLWERVVGNALPTLALGYLLCDDVRYKRFAFEQARQACGYALWGGPDESKEGKDLAAGHLLFGLGVLVDWLGEEMDERTRSLLLEAMKRRGAQMAAGAQKMYWANTLLQNHLWVNMTGLLSTALAIQRYDAAAAHPLIVTAVQRIQPCFAVLASDGSDQEGPGYWTYGAEYLLKYHQLATELLGLKIDSPWLRHTQDYCIAMTLPLESVTSRQSIFDTADSLRTPYYGPDYLLRRLAALNRSSSAQELADRLESVKATSSASDWLNFLWYDPSVSAGGLAATPPQQFFSDLDLMVARSDRSGREAVVVMRAGAPLGRAVQAMHVPHDLGTGHTHPDINHITLFAAGQFLLLDNGYASVKDTFQHNTLIVNGAGQVGSGGQWTRFKSYPLPDPQPKLQPIHSDSSYDYWVGEGAAAYPATAGLKRFDRHVLFLKPGLLIVVDELEAADTADFLLLWHTATKAQHLEDDRYRCAVNDTNLEMKFVLPAGHAIKTGERPYGTHEKGNQVLQELGITLRGKSVVVLAAFGWGKGNAASLPEIVCQDDKWKIRTQAATLVLNVRERKVTQNERR